MDEFLALHWGAPPKPPAFVFSPLNAMHNVLLLQTAKVLQISVDPSFVETGDRHLNLIRGRPESVGC